MFGKKGISAELEPGTLRELAEEMFKSDKAQGSSDSAPNHVVTPILPDTPREFGTPKDRTPREIKYGIG